MNKTEFLTLLRKKLNELPPKDVEETLEYYNEMIDDYIESGYSPEAAVAKMGSVDDVAKQILSGSQPFENGGKNENGGKKIVKERNSALVTVLLILGFPVWFSLLVAAFSVLISVAVTVGVLAFVIPWTLVVSFGATAIGLLVLTPVIIIAGNIPAAVLSFGAVLVLGALCVFSLFAALRLTVLGAKGIAAIFRASFKIIFRKES